MDGFLWGLNIEDYEELGGDEDWKQMEEKLIKKHAGVDNFKLK